jgi:hypothetical protein
MRLLILKCSSRKRDGDAPLPAIERYDGPLWQVLRAHLRHQQEPALHIFGLSAEYGLIPSHTPIPLYDATMDAARADELRPATLQSFADLMAFGYEHVCLGLSNRYLRAMVGWEAFVPAKTTVTITDGPMGTKLGQLRAWLEGRTWMPAARPEHLANEHPRGTTTLAGVILQLTPEQVFERARQALLHDGHAANRFRDWYVLVDDRRVAAKWLASVISGLPTSRFDAANARRALLALGIAVERMVDPQE